MYENLIFTIIGVTLFLYVIYNIMEEPDSKILYKKGQIFFLTLISTSLILIGVLRNEYEKNQVLHDKIIKHEIMKYLLTHDNPYKMEIHKIYRDSTLIKIDTTYQLKK